MPYLTDMDRQNSTGNYTN